MCKDEDTMHACLERAAVAGVGDVVLIGCDIASSRRARAQSESPQLQRSGVRLWFTAGVHPLNADAWDDTTDASLHELAAHPHCVAVGEAGIDLSPTSAHPATPTPHIGVQRWVLQRHLAIATSLNKPLYLHERDAATELLETLKDHPHPRQCLVHCFDNTATVLKVYLAMGMKVGIASMVACEARGERLRGVLRAALPPLDSILLETDAPFFRPDNVPDAPQFASSVVKKNEPCLLPLVALEVANCLNTAPRVVAAATKANAEDFFGLNRRKRLETLKQARTEEDDDDDSNDDSDGHDATPNESPRHTLQDKGDDVGGPRVITSMLLRKLAYCLRGVGVDTTLIRHNDMAAIAREAVRTGRTLLARHDKTGMLSREPGLKLLLLPCDRQGMQLKEVLKHFALRPPQEAITAEQRCVSCNAVSWSEDQHFDASLARDHHPAQRGRLLQCGLCKKASWHDHSTDATYALLLQLLDGHFDHDHQRADDIVKRARGQKRSRCAFWTGIPGSCRNGNSCAFIHSYKGLRQTGSAGCKLPDEVHLVPIHKTHGVLLLRPRLPGGAQWEVPNKRFAPLSEGSPDLEAAIELATQDLGLAVHSDRLLAKLSRSVDTLTGERLDSGRRIYYTLDLDDNDGVPHGTPGSRLPLSGEDMWIAAGRPFTFMEFTAAGRAVKQTGAGSGGHSGDVVGAVVMKRLGIEGGAKRFPRAPRCPDTVPRGVATFYASAVPTASLLVRAALTQTSIDNTVASLQRRLRTKHAVTAPSFKRLLWECPKSNIAMHSAGVTLETVRAEMVLKKDAFNASLRTQSSAFMKIAQQNMATEAVLHDADDVRREMEALLAAELRGLGLQVKLHLFGSSATGTADSTTHDVDLVASVYDTDGTPLGPFERTEECTHLRSLHTALLRLCLNNQHGTHYRLHNEADLVLGARVPIVKATMAHSEHPTTSIPLDLTLRPLGVINTLLIRSYYARYPYLRVAVCVLKQWATWSGLKPCKGEEAGGGGSPMGSYVWVLLLLHALCRKGLVQQIGVEDFLADLAPSASVEEYREACGAEDTAAAFWHGVFRGLDKKTVCFTSYPNEGLLQDGAAWDTPTPATYLEAFLVYYGWEFSYEEEVVSVSDKAGFTKEEANSAFSSDWASTTLCVKDPFEPALNLGRHLKTAFVGDFKRRARLSHALMREGCLGDDMLRSYY